MKDKGNQALAQNKFDDAIKYYSDAIEIDDKNHVLFSNRSAAYAKAGKYKQSLDDAEKTVSLKPDWAKGYSRKGSALAYLGKLDESIDAYEKGLMLDPMNEQIKTSLQEVRSQQMNSAFPNPFNTPDIFIKLKNDPRTKAWLDDPEYLSLLQDLRNNPKSLGKALEHFFYIHLRYISFLNFIFLY